MESGTPAEKSSKEEKDTKEEEKLTNTKEKPVDKPKEPADKAKKRFPVKTFNYGSPPWAITSVSDYDTQFDHWSRRNR